MPFTEDEIASIQADCFANDVQYDASTLASLTEDEIVEFFESGGTTLPEGVVMPKLKPNKPKPKPKPKPQAATDDGKSDAPKDPPLPPLPHRGARRLLCLHEAGACGEIMRRQLKTLKLEAAFDDVAFVDGTLPVDPAVHPDAKQLRAFYSTCPNLQFMEQFETHRGTREVRPSVLAASRPDDRALWEKTQDRKALPTWVPSFRAVEPALQHLARHLAAGAQPARATGVVAFGQGASLLMMLLALLDAAGPDDDPRAARRRARLVPACMVLYCPNELWIPAFRDDRDLASMGGLKDGSALAVGGDGGGRQHARVCRVAKPGTPLNWVTLLP